MKNVRIVFVLLSIAGISFAFGQFQVEKVQELMKQQKYKEVISLCEQRLQNSQRDEEAWQLLAEAYEQEGKFTEKWCSWKMILCQDIRSWLECCLPKRRH
jgi:hypothetical protein